MDTHFAEFGVPDPVREHLDSLADERVQARRRLHARRIVESLFDSHLIRTHVLQALEADGDLDGETRSLAIEIAKLHANPSARQMNGAAWEIAADPGRDALEYERAMHWMELVCKRVTTVSSYWNTLGVAYFRAGRLEKALKALRRSDELNLTSNEPHERSYDLLFIAMAVHSLGKTGEARQLLLEVRGKLPQQADPELLGFLKEAEDLIELVDGPGD